MQNNARVRGVHGRNKTLTSALVSTAIAIGALTLVPTGARAEVLLKPAVDQLLARPEIRTPAADFRGFATAAARADQRLTPAVTAWEAGKPLAGEDLANVARLLGLYNRLRHRDPAIEAIGRMVALPTFRTSDVAPHESPAIVSMGRLVEEMANGFGLEFAANDNRVFEVRLRGTGADEFGILTHADVVPANASEWVLDDGRKLDPFQVTRVGDLLYGRGTIDDKGSIAAALYAMKTVRDSGLPLRRTIRLMIDTTEETGGDAMKYYRERTRLPEYNIVLDSKYPAVVAEKGSGALKASFPVVATPAGTPAIVGVVGSTSANSIPQTASARIEGGDAIALTALATRLERAAPAFADRLASQGGAFKVAVARSVSDGRDGIDVKVDGTSAHGSRPEEGINPVPRLAMFLAEAADSMARNHYTDAVRYIADLFGPDYFGHTLGVAYADDFMGPLTLSPTLVRSAEDQLDVVTNVRMPRGRSPDELNIALATRIDEWAKQRQVTLALDHQQGNWMARDPSGAWLTTLLDIFAGTTGLDAKPVSTAGSTTAKLLPNAINFGPAMPGKKYTAHNAREFKEVPDLEADLQMFAEMLVRIGNLEQMQ